MAHGVTFSSRVLGGRPSLVTATAALRSARCCGNTSSARPWRRWACQPRGRLTAGEPVWRETMLPGAVLARAAAAVRRQDFVPFDGGA